jgi:hypothetical protein
MTAPKNDTGFKFTCPHCSQSLEATAELIGESVTCPVCGKSILVPGPKTVRIPNSSAAPIRNLAITAVATAMLTSGFWWMTPFIARAKGKQAAEGALSALREGFGSGGDSEQQKKENLEREKLQSVVKNKISVQFVGNQRVTITNNSDFEIESVAFEYTNGEKLKVATGSVDFRQTALKSGQTATEDISSHETIKPAFKVRPSYLMFTTDSMRPVSFPD